MAAVCTYFKFGHCKFRQYCRNRHVETVCEQLNCDLDVCENRHPIRCKYYENFGRCKFSPCSFLHVKQDHFSLYLEKINVLENSMKENNLEIETLKSTVKNLKESLDKVNNLVSASNGCGGASNSDDRVKEIEENNYIMINAIDDLEKDVKTLQMKLANTNYETRCHICGKVYLGEQTRRSHMLIEHGVT